MRRSFETFRKQVNYLFKNYKTTGKSTYCNGEKAGFKVDHLVMCECADVQMCEFFSAVVQKEFAHLHISTFAHYLDLNEIIFNSVNNEPYSCIYLALFKKRFAVAIDGSFAQEHFRSDFMVTFFTASHLQE